MKVQVNTSNDIDNKDSLERWANDYLNERLARFDQDITSIEVQMTDENHAAKGGGADKRCMLEARITGIKPDRRHQLRGQPGPGLPRRRREAGHALDHEFGKLDRREHRQRDTIRQATRRCWTPSSKRRRRADSAGGLAGWASRQRIPPGRRQMVGSLARARPSAFTKASRDHIGRGRYSPAHCSRSRRSRAAPPGLLREGAFAHAASIAATASTDIHLVIISGSPRSGAH